MSLNKEAGISQTTKYCDTSGVCAVKQLVSQGYRVNKACPKSR